MNLLHTNPTATHNSPIQTVKSRANNIFKYPSVQQITPPAYAPLSVMIIDSSDVIRVLWSNTVAGIDGLSVMGSFAGAQPAMASMQKNLPDIILMDIHLQSGHSMDVLRLVTGTYPSVKVIIVTSYADMDSRNYYLHAGAYAFFDKNSELKALRDMLKRLAVSRNTAYLRVPNTGRTVAPVIGFLPGFSKVTALRKTS